MLFLITTIAFKSNFSWVNVLDNKDYVVKGFDNKLNWVQTNVNCKNKYSKNTFQWL